MQFYLHCAFAVLFFSESRQEKQENILMVKYAKYAVDL